MLSVCMYLDGLKKHQRRKRRKLMNIRARVTEKLQVEQDHESAMAERVEEKAYPDRTVGTDKNR